MAKITQASGRSRSGSVQTKTIVGIAAQISAAIATYKAYCARFGFCRMKIHIASETTPNKKQNRSESLGFFHLPCLQTLRIVITVGFVKPKTAGQTLASAPELR
jgi:hypothetical protein